MYAFILLSLHIGFISIITGTFIGARENWRLRRPVWSLISALHCLTWCVAEVGIINVTIGGIV